MSKTITSPIAEFAGTVVIPSRLTLPQVMAWETATDEQTAFLEKLADGERYKTSQVDHLFLPVICELAQEWHIEGVPDKPTPETFPMTPRRAAHEFIVWLGTEIRKVYTGEIEVPNA